MTMATCAEAECLNPVRVEDGYHRCWVCRQQSAPVCADGLPCGVAHSPGDDAYCLKCPHERWPEERMDAIGSNGPTGEHYSQQSAAALSTNQPETDPMDMPSKYHVRINGAWCDVYDILQAFGVTNPADAHAIKKMLMPGKRGHKDAIVDRQEAIQSLRRAIELEVGA